MKCPACNHQNIRVIETRQSDDGTAIRRRRECEQCKYRFTSFERIEMAPLMVVKKNGNREMFSQDKLLNGLIRACEKRPIEYNTLLNLTKEVEQQIRERNEHEIPSEEVGEMGMKRLMDIDDVAYVRFASVYKEFKDIDQLIDSISQLIPNPKEGR